MLGWSEMLSMLNDREILLFKKDLMKYECDDRSIGFLCFGESYRQFASKDLIIPISDIRKMHGSFIIESCMLYSEGIRYNSESCRRYTSIGNMSVDVDVVLEIQKEIEKSMVKMPGVLCKIISEYSSPVCGIDVLMKFFESVFRKCQSYLIDNVSVFNLTREDVLANFVNPVNNNINIFYSRELESRYYDKNLNKKKYMSSTDKRGYIKPLIRVTHLEIQKNGKIYLNIELF